MTIRRMCLGLALVAPVLFSTAEAEAASNTRMVRSSTVGFAGSPPVVQRRFHHGVVSRFATGTRYRGSFHRTTNVTMKRGVVGNPNPPDAASGLATGKRRHLPVW